MKNHIVAVIGLLLVGTTVAAPPAAEKPAGSAAPAVAPSKPVQLAAEDGSFTLDASTTVRFGVGDAFITKVLAAGKHTCDRLLFGDDPAPRTAKFCYGTVGPVRQAPAISEAPAVPVSFDVSRPAGYTAVAALMGTDAGVRYRYGEPSSTVVTTTLKGPRPSFDYKTISGQRSEKQSDGNVGDRGCGRDGWCGEYQFGTPDKLTGASGDFSSNIAHVASVPDVVPAGQQRSYGISSLQQFGVAHNAVAWSPEPSWTTYSGATSGGEDPNTLKFAGVLANSPVGVVPMANPVATVRGYGRGGWINNALTVMSNGWIISAGSNTSNNFVKIKLADGKTPTGAAITNSGEFLLVTVWDTAAFKGQVAVIALGDGCAWCETKPESEWESNWGSHRQVYAGLPGLGNYLFGKVIGYVDLPSSMKAPTEISVTTGKPDAQYQRVRNFFNEHLQSEAQRRRYYDGDLTEAIARTGMAVVVSKSEKRAAFIDLRPLFQYYRTQYFTKNQEDWRALIAQRGADRSQWPFTFDVAAEQRPTVIKVVDLPTAPTAVKLSLHAPHRAFIATQEGKLRVFDLGNGYLDQNAALTGKPGDIVEKFAVGVGSNPTSIAYVKEKAVHGATGSALFGAVGTHRHLWVLSRGERKATLLRFDAGFSSASAFRTLQDRRLRDPVAIEDGDNHGTESYTVSIADYAGKKLHTIGYGPIIMWTYDKKAPCPQPSGCKMRGALEYAGSYALPGRPFHVISSNIN